MAAAAGAGGGSLMSMLPMLSGMMGGGKGGGGGGGSSMPDISGALKAPIAGTAELAKLGIGISQAIRASKMAKNTHRPAYQIAPAQLEAVQNARNLATDTRLPGQSLMEQNIGAATAAGNRQIQETGTSTAERLGALSGLYTGQQQQFRDLGIQGAQQQTNDIQYLNQMLGGLANEQHSAWEWNKAQPYLAAVQAIQKLREGANKNIYGGIQGLASSAMMAIPSKSGGGGGGGAQPSADSADKALNMQKLIGKYQETGGTANQPDFTPLQNAPLANFNYTPGATWKF